MNNLLLLILYLTINTLLARKKKGKNHKHVEKYDFNENSSQEIINVELEIQEPFTYFFNSTKQDIFIQMIEFQRFQIDKPPTWCNVNQKGYQYTIQDILQLNNGNVTQVSNQIYPQNNQHGLVYFTNMHLIDKHLYIVDNSARVSKYSIEIDKLNLAKQLTISANSNSQKSCVNEKNKKIYIAQQERIYSVDQNMELRTVFTYQQMKEIVTDIISFGNKLLVIYNKKEVKVFDINENALIENPIKIECNKPIQLKINQNKFYIIDEEGTLQYDTSTLKLDNKLQEEVLGFTEKNEFIKVDGSDLSVDNIEDVVDLYGGNNAIITNDALVIYGKEGAFLNPQDDPQASNIPYLFVVLPQQLISVVPIQQQLIVSTYNKVSFLNLIKFPAYLQCLPGPFEKIDQTYSFQISVHQREKGESIKNYQFEIELVEPLITSSQMPYILAAILGTLLILAIIVFIFIIVYVRHKKEKQTVYENLYNQAEQNVQKEMQLAMH